MEKQEMNVDDDVVLVSRIAIIPVILEIIGRTTNMGFTAVARVTKERWVACAVRDEIKFGLLPGGELKVDTTICHEIRQSGAGVIIDHVAEDEVYANHHTPATYGFQSYISIPISRQDGSFFGTLCAIDPSPTLLNTPQIIGLFKAFASLISFHLNAVEQMTEEEIRALEDHSLIKLKQQFNTLFGEKSATDSGRENTVLPKPIDKRSPQFAGAIQDVTDKVKMLLADLKKFS